MAKAIENPIFDRIALAAKEIQQPVYVVGGFVRDQLLERKQKAPDLDFVTVGSGVDLALAVARDLQIAAERVKVFKRFGTAMIHYKNMDLEFVGARKESYSADSRKPVVENGTLQDDQNRRDFTINALAISLQKDDWGTLIDTFDGRVDLQNKQIRTPLHPDQTFSDDPLRMMRAIRFAAQLNFEIVPEAFASIQQNAERIKIISMERIFTEFQKIMETPQPSYGLGLLEKSGLLAYFLPELTALKGIEEIEGQKHKDNFYHTLEVVDNISRNTENVWLRWAALLHDIGKARTKRFVKGTGWTFHSHEFVGSKMVPRIFRRMRMPMGEEMRYVRELVLLSSRPIPLVDEQATDAALRRLLFDAGDKLEDLFTLCKADITTKNPKKQKRFFHNFIEVEEKLADLEERDRIRNFQPPVSGEEIMQLFALRPGPEIGRLKTAIKDAILEGKIPNDHDAALELLHQKAKEIGVG